MKNLMTKFKSKLTIFTAAMFSGFAFAETTSGPEQVDVTPLLDSLQSVNIQGTITTAGGVVLGVSIAVALIFLVMKIIQRGATGG